jgi:glutamine amidotransferase
MIAIVDYDTAKTADIKAALETAGASCVVARGAADLERAHRIVFPPCESLARAVRTLRDRGLLRPLFRAADEGRWILGIAEGHHLLFDVSYQDGQHTGLGLVPGKVTRFDFEGQPAGRGLAVLHRGWNTVAWTGDHPLHQELPREASYYFDHAYHAEPLDARAVAGHARHGMDFVAAVSVRTMYGVQFLPHLSGESGSRFLRNFSQLN